MAYRKATNKSNSTQANNGNRSQSNLDWNTPKATRTSKREWGMVSEYSCVFGATTHNPGSSSPARVGGVQ